MTNLKHLSKSELLAYSLGSLKKDESQTLGRHLLTCAECRKLLPMPSAERFWALVMTDAEVTDAPENEESEGFVSSIGSSLKLNYSFVWGGAALIIFSFSFLLWFGMADSSSEVAKNFDNGSGSELNFPVEEKTQVRENSPSSTNSNRIVAIPTPKNLKLGFPKPRISESIINRDSNKPNLKQQPEKFAVTRGVSAKCGENKTIEVEFSADTEKFVFRWKAVPKATKYHLYISDDEEILIDEFETERETSYTLNKSLDAAKTYKWKIMVTTEDGKTIVGDSRVFTIKGLQLNRDKPEKKKIQQIRCSQPG
jgi:hypothetical protein